jgi:hypothetical protein
LIAGWRQQFVSNSAVTARVVPVPMGGSGHGIALVGTFAGP